MVNRLAPRARLGALLACAIAGACTASSSSPLTQEVSVAVTPETAQLTPAQTQPFTATVSGSNDTAVSWAVQEGSAGGTVSASGLYTAPSATGTYHVVATSAADGTKSDLATVTVSSSGGGGGSNLSGTVSGTLAAGTYNVTGDLLVVRGTTLTVQPGTTFNFQGPYRFRIFGQIDARGTAQSPILFTAADHTVGWRGMRLVPGCDTGTYNCQYQGAGNDVDQWLEHCIFEYGRKPATYEFSDGQYASLRGGALYVEGGNKLHINNNEFRYNSVDDKAGAVMMIFSGNNQTFTGNVFHHNTAKYQGGAFQPTHMTGTVLVGGSFTNNVSQGGDPSPSFTSCCPDGSACTSGANTCLGGAVFCVGGQAGGLTLSGVTIGSGATANTPDNYSYPLGDSCTVTVQ